MLHDILANPGTQAALIILGVIALLTGIIFIFSRDPCPSCGQQRHMTKVDTTIGSTLEKGGRTRWFALDLYEVSCKTKVCEQEPGVMQIIRAATPEEVARCST